MQTEIAFLSNLLLNNDAIAEAAEIVTPECLSTPMLQSAWSAMIAMNQAGRKIDVLTLAD